MRPLRSTSTADRRETVAVVVVTYNRADLLVAMLDGLAAQTHAPDAVIVVDNASTDHTPEVLGGRAPTCRWRSSGRTTSAAPAASTAACGRRTTQGFDRVWLMDDDVVPAPAAWRR